MQLMNTQNVFGMIAMVLASVAQAQDTTTTAQQQQYVSTSNMFVHEGSCGVPVNFGMTDKAIVALKWKETFGGEYKTAQCGRCMRVTGTKGTLIATVVSACDAGCDGSTVQMNEYAAKLVGDVDEYRNAVPVTWEFVNCETRQPEQVDLGSDDDGYFVTPDAAKYQPAQLIEY